MDKRTAIKNYFKDRLDKISKEVLQGKISERSEAFTFLTEVGLINDFELINFYSDSKDIKSTEFENEKYLVIGDDNGTDICLNVSNGKVYSIDSTGELPARFVNSSIEDLLAFIMVYDRNNENVVEADDDEIGEIVEEIKGELNKYDKAALANEENWWSVILEQVEDGLM